MDIWVFPFKKVINHESNEFLPYQPHITYLSIIYVSAEGLLK
jgi:hypothetical protein